MSLQFTLIRPRDYDVIATLNLNGDYLSDALAAQVGGIGIAPGANINYETGHAIFEATHGTAPKYADLDKVNPGSVILSGEMMFRYMGWTEAADLIVKGMEGADRRQDRHLRLRPPDGRRAPKSSAPSLAMRSSSTCKPIAREINRRTACPLQAVRLFIAVWLAQPVSQARLTSLTSCSRPFSSGARLMNSCTVCARPPVVRPIVMAGRPRLSGRLASVEPIFRCGFDAHCRAGSPGQVSPAGAPAGARPKAAGR